MSLLSLIYIYIDIIIVREIYDFFFLNDYVNITAHLWFKYIYVIVQATEAKKKQKKKTFQIIKFKKNIIIILVIKKSSF